MVPCSEGVRGDFIETNEEHIVLSSLLVWRLHIVESERDTKPVGGVSVERIVVAVLAVVLE